MRPAIYTGFDYTIPFAQAISMVRQAGFEVIALGARPEHSGYATDEGRTTIRKLLEKHGVTIDGVHAPFPAGDQLFALDEAARRESIHQCKIAIDAARDLSGNVVVVHLIQPYGIPHGDARDRMIVHGMQSVEELGGYAAEKGIKLALENGQRADYDQVLADCLSRFADDHIGFCYDSGHENVQGTCFKMLERFGHRLLTLHLHDNLGSDTHMLPYEGNTDWDRFRAILHGLNYSGNLALEVDVAHSRFKAPAVFLAEAWNRAQKLLQAPAGLEGGTRAN